MYLGDDSSIPLINRGAGAYNKPETAAPFKPGAALQDFLSTILPTSGKNPAPKPLILQGGGNYNYPELYAAGQSSYTPPQRAQADLNKLLMVVAASVGIGLLLPGGSRRRSLW